MTGPRMPCQECGRDLVGIVFPGASEYDSYSKIWRCPFDHWRSTVVISPKAPPYATLNNPDSKKKGAKKK